MKPLLVTGCGRSGTAWTAALIEVCGWDCGHERLFCHGDDDVEGFLAGAAEVSGTAAPYAEQLRQSGAVIVHQVRHPLAVVRSALNRRPSKGRPARRRWRDESCPALLNWPKQPASALAYWVHWNALVEPYAAVRWRIEDLWAAEPKAVDLLTVVLTGSGRGTSARRVVNAIRTVGQRNAGPPGDGVSWETLREAAGDDLVELALEQAALYGYAP